MELGFPFQAGKVKPDIFFLLDFQDNLKAMLKATFAHKYFNMNFLNVITI